MKPSLRGRWIIVGLLAAAIGLSHPFWLRALGSFLVRGEEPFRADMALVLAGDGLGQRILKSADLVHKGFTSRVLVSGPGGIYGFNEAELAIPFAVRHGYPESWFTPFPHESRSTRQEAQAIAPELRRLGVRRCLLVTSNYHTRRAGRIFRAAAPQVEFRVIAAADRAYNPAAWWRTREGWKCFVMEWLKTITGWFGI